MWAFGGLRFPEGLGHGRYIHLSYKEDTSTGTPDLGAGSKGWGEAGA